ncbi:hypothetical protein FGL01_15560 [Flavobacterium glycines]|uniref:FAS1 domain-containing protein n=1 Tax=Flavobacterium glycines TaxID=551990 RepID=A0A511CDV6_9FLAO|nr:hypothetical protein FGL01_15560 [Flavobacterium glycines]
MFDEYYGRPDYLEDPIYQQLDARGNFKNFTALIQKAGYKDILSKAGYWTMFAPNDAAFEKYFQDNSISDVSKIDDATAAKIVRYALVYNAFREDQLSDYQGSKGWEVDNAFRRRTAYYDGFLNKTINGQPKVIVGSNRNGANNYISGDNNNKYISYFTKEYFEAKGLSSFDFNYFYPNATYSDFNILDSKVTEADIIAENGIIHEVDKVNVPLVNIDQYLEEDSAKGTGSKYSSFRNVVENNLVSYNFNQAATNTYFNYTGKSDNVYVKTYDSGLSFAPNNENYLKETDNDGQSDAYTLLVPENTKFDEFKRDVLLKHYASIDKLPKYVFQDLVNAHMVKNAVWPSKASSFDNALGEDLRFDFNTDVIEKKVLSNGFFYGVNKVQKSNLFYSVYTSAYLDPNYSLATRLFNDGSGIKEMISNIKNKYVLFLPSDNLILSMGFRYDANYTQWVYTNPVTNVTVSGGPARSALYRILYNSIVYTPHGELDNIATTSGIIRSGDYDLPGEYIKWSNNKVYAAGNEYYGNAVNITGKDVQQNGTTYYVDNLLLYSPQPQGYKIKALGEAVGSQFSTFYNYLKNSRIYNAATGEIQGVVLGTSYTFIVPNNTAMAQAVTDGILPASTAPTLESDIEKVKDFIAFHILVNKTASDDGLTTGQFETLRKDSFGEKTYITVESTPGTLSFKDLNYRTANYIKAQSNNLADRSLIHLVDNYLKFTQQ